MTFEEVGTLVRQQFASLRPGDGRCVVEVRDVVFGAEEPRIAFSWCDHRRGIYVARSWPDGATETDVRGIVADARRQVEEAMKGSST